jgi:formylglycine-generating enzyme required for sulfatase activity
MPTSQTFVRLRIAPANLTRDYRGERYQERPNGGVASAPAPVADATDQPRLYDTANKDVTPMTEPAPLVTIDRLVSLRITPDTLRAAHVILRGACAGTMSDLRDWSSPRTCIDTEAARVNVVDEPLIDDVSPPSSVENTFAKAASAPCVTAARKPRIGLMDEELCVPGGVFVFGSQDSALGADSDDLPQRIAVVPSFYMDRYEVTVARFRAALANGFKGGLPIAHDGPPSSANGATCSWSTMPLGREDYPINCVTPSVARAFCAFEGKALPLEVQWEFAATRAGRPTKTRFPWGDDDIDAIPCSRAVFGSATGQQCAPRFGLASVTAADHPGGDVVAGIGLVDLAGGVAEMSRDWLFSFESNCWASASLTLPHCDETADYSVARGGSWGCPASLILPTIRFVQSNGNDGVGIRCMRDDAP